MNTSLYQKLLKQLGEKGLLQAARAEGATAKSLEQVPETILQKIQNKASRMDRPDIENLPSRAELDAIEKSNLGSDVGKEFRETAADYKTETSPGPKISPETRSLEQGQELSVPDAAVKPDGLTKMLRGMGAAGTAAGAGYVGYKALQPKPGVVLDAGLEGGAIPGALKSIKERIKESKDAAPPPESTPAPIEEPRIKVPVPAVGKRPEDYSAGKFSYDDSGYQKVLSDLQAKEEAAKGEYKSNKTRNEWGDVAERVAQAVAQYGAARQGAKTGVDMSGLKFQRGDYGAKTEQDARDLEREQRSLENQRSTAGESFRAGAGAAERQFGREESARNAATGQQFREYEDSMRANQTAKMKQADMDKEQLRDKTHRTDSMEDFKKRQEIEQGFKEPKAPKETPEDKAAKERQESIQALYSAYLSGDDKEINKARAGATKHLSVEEAKALNESSGAWYQNADKSRAKYLEGLLSSPQAPTPKSSLQSDTTADTQFVTFLINGKEGKIPVEKADAFQKKYPKAIRK